MVVIESPRIIQAVKIADLRPSVPRHGTRVKRDKIRQPAQEHHKHHAEYHVILKQPPRQPRGRLPPALAARCVRELSDEQDSDRIEQRQIAQQQQNRKQRKFQIRIRLLRLSYDHGAGKQKGDHACPCPLSPVRTGAQIPPDPDAPVHADQRRQRDQLRDPGAVQRHRQIPCGRHIPKQRDCRAHCRQQYCHFLYHCSSLRSHTLPRSKSMIIHTFLQPRYHGSSARSPPSDRLPCFCTPLSP